MIKRAAILAALMFTLSTPAFAALPNTYQVTGVVKALTDTVVTVVKGKETFEIAREAATPTTGELKVGAKVTVTYRMSASKIEAKEAGKAAKGK